MNRGQSPFDSGWLGGLPPSLCAIDEEISVLELEHTRSQLANSPLCPAAHALRLSQTACSVRIRTGRPDDACAAIVVGRPPGFTRSAAR
jgi:hypothetical protein